MGVQSGVGEGEVQYLWLLNVVSVCPAVFLSCLFELCGISVAFLLRACVCSSVSVCVYVCVRKRKFLMLPIGVALVRFTCNFLLGFSSALLSSSHCARPALFAPCGAAK